MALPRRLKHAALVAGIVATLGAVRWPHPPPDQPDSAPSAPPKPLVTMEFPRLHPVTRGGPAAGSTSSAPVAGIIGRLPDRRWAAALPVPGPSELTSSRAPSRDEHAPVSRSTPASGDDHAVSELMVCHPDARGPFAAADVLQECINRAPAFSSIEIPPGRYPLTHQVVISTPLTIRTAGSGGTSLSCAAGADQCAVLVAAPNLLTMWGMIAVWSTNNVTLEHVVIDGNRAARTASTAAEFCLTRSPAFGYNASVVECVNCGLDDVVSTNALCGTSMVWSGPQATIQRSAFRANGNTESGLWSDGLTLLYAPRSLIRDNEFVDNSDVALIIGYGVQSRIEQNVVLQRTQSAFAGVMLDNFNSDDLGFRGDFRGAVIAHNTIDCGPQLCAFGIQVGPHPWYPTKNIVGGELRDNEVLGAKIGINVDGAGIWRAPTAIFANSVSPAPSGSYFSECPQPIPAEWMNVAPASIVDRRDEARQAGSHLSESCELWSDLSN